MALNNIIKILFLSVFIIWLSDFHLNAGIIIPIKKNSLVGAVTYSIYNKEDNGSWSQFPVIDLDGENTLSVSFDLLESGQRRLSYRIRKMEYDWQESVMHSGMYLKSFNSKEIENCRPSFSTLVDYCTYQFDLNTQNSIGITKSGNYILSVFDRYEHDVIIFEFPFAVLDEKTSVTVNKSSYNDGKSYFETQGFDIEVNVNEPLYNISSNTRVVVLQNGLWENAVVLSNPSNVNVNALEFKNHNSAVFYGGGQFHKLEHLGDKTYGMGIDHIYMDNYVYNIDVIPNHSKRNMHYDFESDQSGRQVIRSIDRIHDLDYHLVKFMFVSEPITGEDVFLSGECFRFIPEEFLKMKYNKQKGCYELGVFLKMGYQEYKYMTRKNGEDSFNSDKTSGNHYQTINEYTVLVYYRNIQNNSYELIGYNSYKTK